MGGVSDTTIPHMLASHAQRLLFHHAGHVDKARKWSPGALALACDIVVDAPPPLNWSSPGLTACATEGTSCLDCALLNDFVDSQYLTLGGKKHMTRPNLDLTADTYVDVMQQDPGMREARP